MLVTLLALVEKDTTLRLVINNIKKLSMAQCAQVLDELRAVKSMFYKRGHALNLSFL